MSSILAGLATEPKNTVFLNEAVTYKLWESAGKKIVEAQLTADQISQIFQQIEQGATASGANRTMIGKGVDAAGAVNKAWEDLKTKIQNSGPIKNVDAMYDQAAEKLKQATGGDDGVMKYVQKYRDFAKKHPVAQSFIYAALIAASGITGVGLGGAAALGLFKMVDKLLQGEKFSSAAYSGAKTGAMAYGASKIGDLIKGKPADVDPNMKYQPNLGQIKAGQGAGDVVDYGGQMVSGASDPSVARLANWAAKNFDLNKFDYVPKGGTVYIYDKTGELVGSLATDPGLRKAGIVTGKQALEVMKKAAGVYESIDLNEATIKLVFSRAALEYNKQLTEGIMDTLKGAAGKAVGAVKQFGTNLTTKVTADKLNSAWEKAGKPTESGEIATLLVKNGVPQDLMLDVFAKMKIPTTSSPAQPQPAKGTTNATPTSPAKPTTNPTAPNPAAPAGAATPAASGTAKPVAPATAPAPAAAPATATKPGVNPELQKRLAARKAGKPVYSGGLEEAGYYNPLDQERDEQNYMDFSKRDFKRREHEAEWEREQELTRQREERDSGTWYIRINGKIFKDRETGEPAEFSGKKHANAVALKMMQKEFNKGKEFMLTTKPEDKIQEEQLDEDLRKWFKEKWVRFGPDGKIRGACARGDDSEGKPKCLPQSKAHSLGKKGRASAAARKRREDPNPERSGKAINVNTKKKSNEGVAEEQIDELKCWPGYTRVQGVPAGAPGSCKKKTSEDQAPMFTPEMKCPHCNGEMVSEELMNEKKDACYYKVKSRYKVWPSAYASGALVKCRKKGASNWGNSSKKESAILKGIIDEAPGDTLLDPEVALQQARKITKAIKYERTSTDIIVQMQMLAERTEGIDTRTLESNVDEVYAAQRQLESAVYGLEEAFEDAVRQAQYRRDDEEDLNEMLKLDEGLGTKIASVALGLVLALGAGKVMAEEMYVYQDATTKKLRVAAKDKIPADALMSFKVDTDSKTVSMIKGNQVIPVQVQPEIVKQAQQQASGQAAVQPQPTTPQQSNIQKGAQKVGESVIFTGYNVDEIKDKIMDKMLSKDKDWQFDDNGRIMTAVLHNAEGKSFAAALYKSLAGPRGSSMNLQIKFVFSTANNQVKVTPQMSSNITNAFGKVETQPIQSPETLESLAKMFSANEGQIYSTGGGAGQSYRKFTPKVAGTFK